LILLVFQSQKIVNYSVPITTDISWIENTDRTEPISNDGFVMVATSVSGGFNLVISEGGYLSQTIVSNAPLSWANLHIKYHRHDRAMISGSLNYKTTTFYTCKRVLEQVELSIENCDCPIGLNKFKTELGDEYLGGEYGYPITIETTFNGLIRLNLKYGEPGNANNGLFPNMIEWGLFPKTQRANASLCGTTHPDCNAGSGCAGTDWDTAYQDTDTDKMYWDEIGAIPISSGVYGYFMDAECAAPPDPDLPYCEYIGYWELDEDSVLIGYFTCP
jgi:hypothetical protein